MSESLSSYIPPASVTGVSCQRQEEAMDRKADTKSLKLIYRRTFLSWLHFAVVLGGLAVGLLNFGDKVNSQALSS